MAQEYGSKVAATEPISLANESFLSRTAGAVADCLGGVADGVSNIITNEKPSFASDVFWMMEFGPFGPWIRDAWFKK